MYILKRYLFIINENKKETDLYLKTLVDLTDKQKTDIKTIYDKLHATPYLINFIKYYTEQDITIDNILNIIQWLKGTKQYKLLPNNIEYYKKFEKLQDDIKEIQDYGDIKKLYDYLKMDIRNCSFDDFKKIGRSFLELDENKRKQFTPLKYFRLHTDISKNSILNAITSFINGLYDPDYEKNTRILIDSYIEKGLVHVIYNKQDVDNSKLVISIDTHKKEEKTFKDLTTNKWCINYNYAQYSNTYLVPTNTFILVHDFNIPSVMENSMFGIVFTDVGNPYGNGGCQNKNNDYIPVETISKITNIPIEYIAPSDFDRKRIEYYIKNFTEIFEKTAIDMGGVKGTPTEPDMKLVYMFDNYENMLKLCNQYHIKIFSDIEEPFLTYVVILSKSNRLVSHTYKVTSDTNVLESCKKAFNESNMLLNNLNNEFKTPYEFLDSYKYTIKFFEDNSTLTIAGILKYITKIGKYTALQNNINKYITIIIESNQIKAEYIEDVRALCMTFYPLPYNLNTLLDFYIENLTIENFTKFVTGYKFILDNKLSRSSVIYTEKIAYEIYKNDIIAESIAVFYKILPDAASNYYEYIINTLFLERCGSKIDNNIIILPTFNEWLININKINDILELNDITDISELISSIDVIKCYISDADYIKYLNENDIDIYDIYDNIKENDINKIDNENIINLFEDDIIQPKDTVDYALLYKNNISKHNDIFFKKISDGELDGEYYIEYKSLQAAADDLFNTKEHSVNLEDVDFFNNDYNSSWEDYQRYVSNKILYFLYYYFIKKGFIFSKKYTPKMLNDRKICSDLKNEIETIIEGDYEDDSNELYDDFDYKNFQYDLSRILNDCQRRADESEYYDKNIEKILDVFDVFKNGNYYTHYEKEVAYYNYIEENSSIKIKNHGYVKFVKINSDNTMTVSNDGVEHIVPRKILDDRVIFKMSESFIKKVLDYDDIFEKIIYQSGNEFGYETLITIFKEETDGLEPYNGDYYGNIDGDFNEEDFTNTFLEHDFEGDIDSYWEAFDKKYSKLFK